jgi:hypothetical protein
VVRRKKTIRAAAMERRARPRRDWVIGKDDTGRAVLEWKIGSAHTDPGALDACARTYDFLERLDVPGLTLEDEPLGPGDAVNPYDHCPSRQTKSRDD